MESLFDATLKATAELRQKDPLAHRRRRRQRPSNPMSGMGGMNVHDEMKGMLGELGPDDMKKADKLWKMLDNMYENDPEEYKTFIEAQMKLGEEHKQAESDAEKNSTNMGKRTSSTSSSSTAGIRSSKAGRSFTPKGSFVVKAYGRYLKQKIFLNICCHPGVQRPMGSSGKEVEEDTQPHLARQIPLLVGAPRDVKDAAGVGCTAIDVVFNSWVTTQAEHNTIFKSQVVDLAMKWITTDYPDIKFDTRWKTPNSKYKGGTGPKGNQPIPFPVELAMDQSGVGEAGGDESASEGKKTEDSNVKSSINSSSINPLSSPASLLAETRRSTDSAATTAATTLAGTDAASNMMNINGASSKVKSTKKKTMIQEVDANGNVKTKKSKKKKKSVKKGFLLSGESDLNLYGPEGSNETGFVTGRPKKGSLLDRCKVVDTRSMSQDTLDQTMKEYAATGTTSAPGTGPRTKPTPKSQQVPIKSKPQTKKPLMTKQQEEDFDRLMAAADPEALSDAMSNVLESSGMGMDALGLNAGDVASLQKMLFEGGNQANEVKSKKDTDSAPPAPIASESVPALKGSFNLPALMHTMEVTKDKKGKDIVRVIIECPSEVADLGQMELDLSDKTMRLNVPGAQQLVLKFQQKVLSTQAKAKFKKNKSLVVSIPIAK